MTKRVVKKSGRLTPRQERFVAEYLKDLNAAAAARRAGTTAKRADQAGYELLRKPEIAAAIAAGRAKQLDNANISAARVLEEVRRCAMVDPRQFFDKHGNARAITDLSAEEAAALAGFEIVIKNAAAGDGETDTVHKFKLTPKLQALELLCKHLGLLKAPEDEERPPVAVYMLPEGARVGTK